MAGTILDRSFRNDNHILLLHVKHITTFSQEVQTVDAYVQVYLPVEVFHTVTNADSPRLGSFIQLTGSYHHPEEARNPGNFCQASFYRYLQYDGLFFTKDIMKYQENPHLSLKEWLTSIRMSWSDSFREILGEQDGGLLSALLLGERHLIDQDTRLLYQKSGIGHILAISGLHLTFIGLVFYHALRWMRLKIPIAGVVSCILLLFYVLMVGWSPSTIRALVMYVLKMGAILTGRRYDTTTALGLSSICVILWRPLVIFHVGFQFSFVAILGLMIMYPIGMQLVDQSIKTFEAFFLSIQERCSRYSPLITVFRIQQVYRFLCLTFCANLSITLAILPIQLYHFYEFPAYSIFINVLILPLLSVILCIGLGGSIVLLIHSQLATLLLTLNQVIFRYYDGLSRFFLTLPGSRIITGQPRIWQMYLYYILLFTGVCVWKKTRERKAKSPKLALVCVCFALILLFLPIQQFSPQLIVTMIDVGQGDGIHIRTPSNTHVLIDGGSLDQKQVGLYRLEPYLLSQAVSELEYVILSHDDEDHSSGVMELLHNQQYGVKIKNLILPPLVFWKDGFHAIHELAIQNGISVFIMKQDDILQIGEVTLTCYAPKEEFYYASSNDSSLIIGLRYHQFGMLLTGDIEAEAERVLIRDTTIDSYQILKVAHHGSKTSTSELFAQHMKPSIAMISSGVENRFGHPHQEVLERLERIGVKLYQTNQLGAIRLYLDEELVRIEAYLNSES